jgi:hypothetical protein
MTGTSDRPRRSKTKQREFLLSTTTKLLGCAAVIVTIAVVFRVVMLKLWESPKIDPEYVQSVYADHYSRKWSGDSRSETALLDPSNAPITYSTQPKSSAVVEGGVRPPEGAGSGMAGIDAKRNEIEAALKGFFEADSVDEKLQYCRDADRVRPLMVRYYAQRPIKADAWRGLGWVMPVAEPGYRFGYAQALFDQSSPVELVVEEVEDGSIRVDWESTVRYAEQEWAEFLETRPETPTLFRVIASKALQGAGGQASSVLGRVTLELKHPAEDGTVLATFDGSDPKFKPLIDQLKMSKWKDVPLTLRLCYPGPSGEDATVRIADVEGKGWLILQNRRS